MGRRRALIAVVAGMLALGVLAGCRTEPGTAAFVGDTRITTSQVNDVLDGYKADGGQIEPAAEGGRRRTIANLLAFNELAKRYAAEKNLPAPQADEATAAAAQAYHVPATDPWARLVAEYQANLQLLTANVSPANVTEADYNATADLLLAQGVQGDRGSIVNTLKAGYSQQIAQGVGVRNELTPLIQRENVSMNPLFGPGSVALTFTDTGLALTALPLAASTSASPAVVDIPKAE